MSSHIRTQVKSNGEMRIWKWPFELGPGYYGKQVTCEIRQIKLTEERRKKLEEIEEASVVLDRHIRKHIA